MDDATRRAVGELIETAFRQFGGQGDALPHVLRPKDGRRGSEDKMKRTGKRIYIAGRITGLVYEDALRKFCEAAAVLERLGHEVHNPRANSVEKTDAEGKVLGEGGIWEREMRRCLADLVRCDAIYLLPDWELSRGAKLEHHVARELGMPVYYESRLPHGGTKRRCPTCGRLAFRFEFGFGPDHDECYVCLGRKPGGDWLATVAGETK